MRIINADLQIDRIEDILDKEKFNPDIKMFSASDIYKILKNAPEYIQGEVAEAEFVHKRFTSIKPIAHHYEEIGEKPYIKYGCPVCETLGNKHQLTHGVDKCPLCNVNLTWEMPTK